MTSKSRHPEKQKSIPVLKDIAEKPQTPDAATLKLLLEPLLRTHLQELATRLAQEGSTELADKLARQLQQKLASQADP